MPLRYYCRHYIIIIIDTPCRPLFFSFSYDITSALFSTCHYAAGTTPLRCHACHYFSAAAIFHDIIIFWDATPCHTYVPTIIAVAADNKTLHYYATPDIIIIHTMFLLYIYFHIHIIITWYYTAPCHILIFFIILLATLFIYMSRHTPLFSHGYYAADIVICYVDIRKVEVIGLLLVRE